MVCSKLVDDDAEDVDENTEIDLQECLKSYKILVSLINSVKLQIKV